VEAALQGAANTKRGYAADLRSFEDYCQHHQLSYLPVKTTTVAGYISQLADRGLKYATIRRAGTFLYYRFEQPGGLFKHLRPHNSSQGHPVTLGAGFLPRRADVGKRRRQKEGRAHLLLVGGGTAAGRTTSHGR
jgi:hypothetical protein